MPSVLKNVLRFSGLVIGVPQAQAHGFNYNNRPLPPDNVWANGGGYTIVADATNITVTRTAAGAASVDISAELWHSYEDDEPVGGIAQSLLPFIMQGAGGGGGGGGGVEVSAGTQVAATGTAILSNSNGLSFGMAGSQTITASMDAFRSMIAGAVTATGPTFVFSNLNGVTFGIAAGVLTASVQTAGGTATGVAISAGTQVATTGAVVFTNSNGISFGLNAQTLSASYDAIKSISAGTTQITNGQVVFTNSNGLSFGVNGQSISATADYVRSISAGTTNATGNQIVFSNRAGLGGVSFGANGATVTASAYVPSAQKVVGYTATGGESDFSVTMAAVPSTNYDVFPALAGVSNMPVIDCPKNTNDRALTAFRVIPSGVLASGDQLAFLIFAT